MEADDPRRQNLIPFQKGDPASSEAQKKSVAKRKENKLRYQMFVEEAMKAFHKDGNDKKTFLALAEKAAKGDIQALEALRKWIVDDKENGDKGTTINVVVTDKEKVAIGKWSE